MLCVGPVERTSAHAWIGWTKDALRRIRCQSPSASALPTRVLDDVDSYLDVWDDATLAGGDVVECRMDVDPEELQYLTYAIYNLDLHLADQAEPTEGHSFHVVLVRDLLLTLAQVSPSQAAFAAQLRPTWPVAVEAE